MILDSVKTQDGFPLDSTQKHYYISARTVFATAAPSVNLAEGSVWFNGNRAVPDPTTGRVPGLFRTQAAAYQIIAQDYIDEANKAMKAAAKFHAVGE